MTPDFSALGLDLNTTKATKVEETEAEEQEERQEPQKPKVDHSIPVRQRVEEERSKLKFEATVMGSFQRQAAKIIGDMILWEFDHHPEREQEWDYNEWTLVDFLKTFAEEARKQVSNNGDQALFAGRTEDESDPTMELVRSIIHRKNEKPKPTPKAKATTTMPTPTPKKEEPQKDHEQIKLNFDDLFN